MPISDRIQAQRVKNAGFLSVFTFLTVQFYARGPSDPNRATISRPRTGDRPGSMGVDSTVAGMAVRDCDRIGLDTQILHRINGLPYVRQPWCMIRASAWWSEPAYLFDRNALLPMLSKIP